MFYCKLTIIMLLFYLHSCALIMDSRTIITIESTPYQSLIYAYEVHLVSKGSNLKFYTTEPSFRIEEIYPYELVLAYPIFKGNQKGEPLGLFYYKGRPNKTLNFKEGRIGAFLEQPFYNGLDGLNMPLFIEALYNKNLKGSLIDPLMLLEDLEQNNLTSLSFKAKTSYDKNLKELLPSVLQTTGIFLNTEENNPPYAEGFYKIINPQTHKIYTYFFDFENFILLP